MITEDYVSFETAKLLKKKGYWNIATMLYKENGDIVNYNVPLNNKGFSSTLGVFYEAPTLQMAMKWLREVHKLGVFPSTYTNIVGSNITYVYGTAIVNLNTHELMTSDFMARDTYNEACEAAIRYCLENLI